MGQAVGCLLSIGVAMNFSEKNAISCILSGEIQVAPGHGKSWNLERPFSRPGKSWKIAKVMEESWKMMIISWNFYYCAEQFCKSDKTSRTANELVLDCCEIFVNRRVALSF